MKEQTFQTRYPNYDVLDKWSSPDWDDQTREVVRKRLEDIPPIRFFSEDEARTLRSVAERIVPQPDRGEMNKVQIVPWIDEKLYEDKRDGYRYEEMPPQREAWRLGLKGINETARTQFENKDFVDLDPLSQDVVLLMSRAAIHPAIRGKRFPRRVSSKTCCAAPLLKFITHIRSLGMRLDTTAHRRRAAMYASGKAALIPGKRLRRKQHDA